MDNNAGSARKLPVNPTSPKISSASESSTKRPNTPVNRSTLATAPPMAPIPAEFFYNSINKAASRKDSIPAPNLPPRPAGAGSNSTKYMMTPPADSHESPKPPSYSPSHDTSDYREPVLVSEEPVTTSAIDPVTSADNGWDIRSWDNPDDPWRNGNAVNWDTADWGSTTTPAASSWNTQSLISNRNLDEELVWWNPVVREQHQRPGPGILATVLQEKLHDGDHTLYSVKASPPSSLASEPPPAPTTETQSAAVGPSTSAGLFAKAEEEVRISVPHPNAYYCPKENGWVLLAWKSSSIVPPLSATYLHTEHAYPIPRQRDRTDLNCLDAETLSFGSQNKTHHFHSYESSVDSLKLSPPYRPIDWTKPPLQSDTSMPVDTQPDAEGMLLNLHMCCQCSFYCVASPCISGVIPIALWDQFVKDRHGNPQVGQNAQQAVYQAAHGIALALGNLLWKGKDRPLKASGDSFTKRIGWGPITSEIFQKYGFTVESNDKMTTLIPPIISASSALGQFNRARVVRGWLEVMAWLDYYSQRFTLKGIALTAAKDQIELPVKVTSATEDYQDAIGSHPRQFPRGDENTDALNRSLDSIKEKLEHFGLTARSYSHEMAEFAYLAQCRCDPTNTTDYFTTLTAVQEALERAGTVPDNIQLLYTTEMSRGRFTTRQEEQAIQDLGFGPEGALMMEYSRNPAEMDDETIVNAWRAKVKNAWDSGNDSSGLLMQANDAFRIIAESRGSVKLHNIWENSKDKMMSPEQAYATLGVPKDADDDIILPVYEMRLAESVLQQENMKDALSVIANHRNSSRLKSYLQTGQDPGNELQVVQPDWPRGLAQLANTCYLNSLLQYFYTIKDLRESVIPLASISHKAVPDEKLSDDILSRHRVGGRLVTRREIIRSRKFISQLADLFFQLEHAEGPAVTPTIDLAKLALVTSKDEEEDEPERERGGTESSNDTDATLVDEGPPSSSRFNSTVVSSASHSTTEMKPLVEDHPMDLDDVKTTADVEVDVKMISRPSSPLDEKKVAPPLPPRRRSTTIDTGMLFGRQHDVSECMDNCMFQIETAMLKFDGTDVIDENGDNKSSVVKRLFYGAIRQRLGVSIDTKGKAVEPKLDLFSHLPINVAEDGFDIYDGLGQYFDDTVEFEGQKVPMEISLVTLPALLQVQLQRVQFDRDTLQSWKSQAYVKFDETIYMDRFVENVNTEKRARSKEIQQELSICRDRLGTLLRGKNGSTVEYLEQTLDYLSGLTIRDDELIEQLKLEVTRVTEEIASLRARLKSLKEGLEDLWKDERSVEYELTSVFIHRGSNASFGHYFFYSRFLPGNGDQWFKYNDAEVQSVSKDEVFRDSTGDTANPYLLVYARKGADVIDTVKRTDLSRIIDDQYD